MLLVQKFLLNNSLKNLKNENIEYSLFENRYIQLNYSMISADESSEMCNQCRALILYSKKDILSEDDIVGETEIASLSFSRFFNLGQNNANIDFSKKICIFEKLDGSLINIYYHNGVWRISSRSIYNGENELYGSGFTFKTLVIKAINDSYNKSLDEFTSILDTNKTWIFEIISPVNKIVVNYDNFELVLIGCRDKNTGLEEDIRNINIGLKIPKIYDFNSLSEETAPEAIAASNSAIAVRVSVLFEAFAK